LCSKLVASSVRLAGKKPLARTVPFSPFVLAVFSSSPTLYVSFGILVLPPSVAGEEMSRCVVHMSGSSAFSNQSLQWCCLVYSSVLWYFLDASVCSAWILCSGSFLLLYDCLPNLFALFRSCVSSLVHQRLDFGVILDVGTFASIAACVMLPRVFMARLEQRVWRI
jgi:hypothetical protein